MKNKKDINIIIGKNLRKARENAGITQDKLAELISLGTKNISAIERGVVGISLTTAVKICDVLEISFDFLFNEEGATNTADTRAEYLIKRIYKLPTEQRSDIMDIIEKIIDTMQKQ